MGFEPPPSEFIYQKKNTGSYYYSLKYLYSTTILPAKSDSDVMFC